MSKMNAIKQILTKKAPYFIGAGLVLIVIGLLAFASGYWPSDSASSSIPMSRDFGVLNSAVPDEEKQGYISTFIARNQGISDACEIVHFYSDQCGACQRLEPWIIAFKTKYPEVQMVSHELSETGSRALFNAKQREYGVSSVSIPVIFICGAVIVGVEPIETAFEPMVLAAYNLEPRDDAQIPVRSPLELALT